MGNAIQGPRGAQGPQGPPGPVAEIDYKNVVELIKKELAGMENLKGLQGPPGPAGPQGLTNFNDLSEEQKNFIIKTLVDKYMTDFSNKIVTINEFRTFIVTELAKLPNVRGPQGIPGQQGLQGVPGPRGDKGDKGDTGSIGPQGIKGDVGPIGPQGIKGDTGPIGPQGIKGDTGPQGPQGIPGPIGPQGIKGDDYTSSTATTYFKKNTVWCADGKCVAPGEKIIINQNKNPESELVPGYIGNDSNWGFLQKTYTGGVADYLLLDSSDRTILASNGENVGIRTSYPTNTLHVATTNNKGITVASESTTDFANSTLRFTTKTPKRSGEASITLKSGLEKNIQFYNSTSDLTDNDVAYSFLNNKPQPVAEITNSGQLRVSSSAPFSIFRLNNTGSGELVSFINNSTRAEDGGPSTATIRNDVGSLRLMSGEKVGVSKGVVHIDKSGNVGVNTQNPQATLDINGSLKIGGWTISEDPGNKHLVFQRDNASDGDDQPHLRMATDGNFWVSRSINRGWIADTLNDKYVKYNDKLKIRSSKDNGFLSATDPWAAARRKDYGGNWEEWYVSK